jgi:hypothetical protein
MKVDKEQLAKHRFWILLGVVVPLLLAAVIYLWTGVAGAIESERQKIQAHQKELDNLRNVRSQPEYLELEKKEKALSKRRDEVWKKAWDYQGDLMTWPTNLQPALGKLYFGDVINDELCSQYAQERNYQAQLLDIVKLAEPTEFKGGWEGVIRHVQKWERSLPTPEEVWLAAEDLWAQRELLQVIREANRFMATYKPADGAGAPDKANGEVARQRFQNPYWQLDLTLVKKPEGGGLVLRGKIKNLARRRQAVQRVDFKVWLTDDPDAPPETVSVESEPLPADGEAALQFAGVVEKGLSPEKPVKNRSTARGLFRLEQVLDDRTVPVKRIDQIALGYNSHRTSYAKLVTAKYGEVFKKDEKPADEAAGNPAGAVGLQGPIGEAGPGMMMRGGPIMGGAGTGSMNTTTNGLVRDRYLEVTPQVRRMPVGLLLVVDQAHVQDVLTAMANSRLRIQITQVQGNHFHGLVKEPGDESAAAEREGERPDGRTVRKPPVAPGPSGSGEAMRRMMLGSGVRGMTGGTGEAAEEESADAGLLELAVYGIASFYERYPPKPTAKEGDAGAAGAEAPKAGG